jgi:uncharacterized protein YdaU (DUF1376 family)
MKVWFDMHYYQHHIGDFIKDTSFLTNEEIGIYLKLIWLYYDSEKPLPNNLFELGMKTGTRDNRVNLEGLLGMFFVLDMENQCWHHTRCDKEIAHYKQQLTTASKAGKASALKRAMNKNPTSVQQALNERSTEVQPTNNQQPITNNQKKKEQRGLRLASDFSFPLEWEQFCQQTRPELSPVKTFDQFKDYWIAQAGQKGVKLDWFATWRNWVRSTNAPKQNPADIVRLTVAPSNEPDPALEKIKADALKAAPMPDFVRQFAKQVRKV